MTPLLLGLGLCRLAVAAPAADDRLAGLQAVALDRRPELLRELELPATSRDAEAEDPVVVPGPWRLVATVEGVRTWEAALPVRPRTLFFHRPPDGMALLRRKAEAPWSGAGTVRHSAGLDVSDEADTWEFSTHALRVRRAAAAGAPEPGEYAVRYPQAVERERGLQRQDFAGDDEAFVFRSFQVDDTTRHGLLLPAPARARFEVQVPDGAVLDLSAGILPPEAAPPGLRSDGATLEVRVDGERVARFPVAEDRFADRRVDLSAHGGRTVDLELVVDPGDDAALDYVLVASPVVHAPMQAPPRVVVLFVDTLRQDGLSLYGYARPTTPRIDAWAQDAAVFEQARSVAPWTLPSSRAIFLGTQPERWGQVRTLQERASAAGWATSFVSGNVYLSSNFEMDQGWDEHRCINWPRADVQVERALDWLQAHDDRPALLVLHLMDMHLPYTEPAAYRHLFAGEHPAALGSEEFLRGNVTKARGKLGEAGEQYVRDRYDNSLRFVDDQLARIVDTLDPRDTVVLLADHGEEFWDHGGFEHGHTLYDELLRVPLVIRAPGMTAGRVDAPVSLVDVAPTLAAVMGLDTDGMTGRPLQGAADGSDSVFAQRPIGFGRPLYGLRRWGVLHEGWKYTAEDGAEHLYDLSADPAEAKDLGRQRRERIPGLVQALGEAVERPAAPVLRLEPARTSADEDFAVTIHAPGGIGEAWPAEDPLAQATIEVERLDAETVRITWVGRSRGVREAYVHPVRDLALVLPELSIEAQSGEATVRADPQWSGEVPAPSGKAQPLFRVRAGGRSVTIDRVIVPLPMPAADALTGVDAELQRDLEALGYIGE